MSVDQLASGSSFGAPNARPPPSPPLQKTPKTTVQPSSVFETPRPATGRLDDSGGWTPHFAEEYSLFNATPGNLRASPRRGFFPGEFGSGTPFAANFLHHKPQSSPALGGPNKRRLSAEGIAEEIATHATHFSNLPLPPVDPSQRLPSSPAALALTHDEAQAAHSPSHSEDSSKDSARRASASGRDRSPKKAKKARLGVAGHDDQGQTATPPPSSNKGGRKLAPKAKTSAMQNDQGFGDFSGAGAGNQHHNMGVFVTSPSEMFGFPMSAPASAHSFVNSQQFWETEAGSMGGMELEFSAAQHAEMFQTPATATQMGQHRPAGSMDWGRANQMFQETGLLPQQQQPEQTQEQQQQQQHAQTQQLPQQQARRPPQAGRRSPAKRERPLAPKTMMPTLDTSANAMRQSMMVDTSMYQTSMEDSFGLSHGQVVDPGMLFSRPPPSSSMEAVFNPMQQQQQQQQMQQQIPSVAAHRALAPASGQQPPHQQGDNQNHGRNVNLATASAKGLGISAKAPAVRGELRRANSVKEPSSSKRGNRAAVSSPAKPRPAGLSRSFSENRGGSRHQITRPSSASSTSSHHTVVALENQLQRLQPATGTLSRPSSHGRLSAPNGRASPLKSNQGHRLPSLTSIPESSPGAANAAAVMMNRASVKFTIDANGRARVDTVVADDEPPPAARRGRSSRKAMAGSRSSSRWDSTDDDGGGPVGGHDDDDASSTDDEPIIIPSRNTSFAIPDPLKVSGQQRARYQTGGEYRPSQRSLSVHSASSSILGRGGSSSNDPESDGETVVNGGGRLASGAGDAASELERLRQSRQNGGGGAPPRLRVPGSGGSRQRFGAPTNTTTSFGRAHPPQQQPQQHQQQHQQYSSAATSPTTLTEVSLPTPSTANRTGRGIRCVCDNTGVDHHRDGFMVQCDSCELWLHGRCINIPKRSMMPSVYICAFCARTSHGRAGRPAVPPSAMSPLAHKSFTKFR
ncbi:hypothetical protein, variant [Gaeumannomyces tritici R3-111a-1]|uniref:PHD-type domain-containing protein n=1 Tax=Gaeumannomyces tritici (strain R3-111a-1) TaxID=644352 RepID=J3P975_GAET3|nr:hypothetical protein GGTG_10059 [Gaeumannomyces tritici R3-111a-1]XP_009226185.1 hypothetical protein, variant [Gaeumannomyces tritici R3-111a-1]EJT73210.1 hypothetical protein, variant [Gaeumannomyces tritici R3-111a-1]EJT73211.1 hypothetical protein GGTG_10059 [Gaeumannomyces tritici R3-111a-1]